VVIGTSEVFADLGMEFPDAPEGEIFRPLGEYLFAVDCLRAPIGLLIPAWAAAISGLKRGRGATVSTCTGTDATGARRRRLFGADFESMEGAAVALAGQAGGIPVIEIRAVSNFAARRDGEHLRPENLRRALDTLVAFWAAHRGRLTGFTA
jgi:futalosine hydrolase